MAIKMVRQPSETPNINNIDDIIGLRYAYGNQDGYVIGKGNELSHSAVGNTFKINSGRVVLQGVESDVDANGVTLVVDNVSELRYYTVYYQVNMATNTTSILLSNYDTATYPVIDKGDDLTENTIGIANLELYHFQAQNGVISNIQKVVKPVKYSNDVINEKSAETLETINNKFADNSQTKFGEYAIFKGKNSIDNNILIQPNERITINFNEEITNSLFLIETKRYVHTYGINPSTSAQIDAIAVKQTIANDICLFSTGSGRKSGTYLGKPFGVEENYYRLPTDNNMELSITDNKMGLMIKNLGKRTTINYTDDDMLAIIKLIKII